MPKDRKKGSRDSKSATNLFVQIPPALWRVGLGTKKYSAPLPASGEL